MPRTVYRQRLNEEAPAVASVETPLEILRHKFRARQPLRLTTDRLDGNQHLPLDIWRYVHANNLGAQLESGRLCDKTETGPERTATAGPVEVDTLRSAA